MVYNEKKFNLNPYKYERICSSSTTIIIGMHQKSEIRKSENSEASAVVCA